MLLVVDIDGTLADFSHRLSLIDKPVISDSDFKAFLRPALVAKDIPYPNAKEGLSILMQQAYRTYFITSRQENLREITTKWLNKHMGVVVDDNLLMRPIDSYSLATVHKANLFIKYIVPLRQTNPNLPTMFVDDDPYVLHFYSKYGIALKAPECWNLMIHAKPVIPEAVFNK